MGGPPRTARRSHEDGGKLKEESKSYRFLEGNNDDGWRHALIPSLLLFFFLFPSLLVA